MVLYSSTSLFKESLNLRPMSQYICVNFDLSRCVWENTLFPCVTSVHVHAKIFGSVGLWILLQIPTLGDCSTLIVSLAYVVIVVFLLSVSQLCIGTDPKTLP